jgi:hypothetical protein
MSRTENLGFNGDYKTTTQTISLKKGSAFTFTSYRERLKLAAVGERKRKWEAERDNWPQEQQPVVTAQLSPPFCGGCTAGHVKPHVVQTLPHVSSHAIDKSSITASKWTTGNYPRSFRWNYRQLFSSHSGIVKCGGGDYLSLERSEKLGHSGISRLCDAKKAAETHWHIQKGVDFRSVCAARLAPLLFPPPFPVCWLAGLPFYVVVLSRYRTVTIIRNRISQLETEKRDKTSGRVAIDIEKRYEIDSNKKKGERLLENEIWKPSAGAAAKWNWETQTEILTKTKKRKEKIKRFNIFFLCR